MHDLFEWNQVEIKHDSSKQDIMANIEILDLQNEGFLSFEEDLDLLQYKQSINGDDHLHDTIPHVDDFNVSNETWKKIRKNLNAKKRKKSKNEIDILEAYFNQDSDWSRATVKNLKLLLPNLSVDQIYKWGYDRKHLIERRMSKTSVQKKVRRWATKNFKGNKF